MHSCNGDRAFHGFEVFMFALFLATATAGADMTVTEYFGVRYQREPVSFDVPFAPGLGLAGVPSQVDIVEPGKTARLWPLVDFDAPGEKSFDMALDRYVYPRSGCWEESHGYAGHTIRTVTGVLEAAPASEILDREGRVTKVKLADGREVVAFLNSEPFEFKGDNLDFAGSVGLAIRQGGRVTPYPIRADRLAAK